MSSKMDLIRKARAATSKIKASEHSSPMNTKSSSSTKWRYIYMVAALCLVDSLKITMITLSAWPYLENMDHSTRQAFFGLCKTFGMISNIFGSFLAGWLANRMMDTRVPILFGIILWLLTGIFYANIEVFEVDLRRWAYLLAEVCFGFSEGTILTWRTFLSMASAIEDRQRAFALTNMAINAGLVISPFIVLPLGKLFSDSMPLPWGAHLNIFTAPVYISVLLFLSIAILFAFYFDGSFQVVPKDEANKEEEKEPGKLNLVESTGMDWLVLACCFTIKFVAVWYFVYSVSLSSSLTMATFGWSGEQSMAYSTSAQGAFGVIAVLVSIGFSTKYLSKLTEERCFVLISLALMLLFYLLTFPWPFLTAKMPSCDLARYSWCESVPAINVYVYHIALIGCMGLAVPIVSQNLDVLYSRLLGPVKQGIFQAVFNFFNALPMMFGPPLLNFVYQNYGPLPIWLIFVSALLAATLLWICNYRRLVPK